MMKRLVNKGIFGVSILFSATLISGFLLSFVDTSAISTSATASVNVAEACTMSSTLTSPHTATIPPNTNQTDIGITTIKVTCNDASGYSIYAVGYTGNEIGGTNSTKLVGVANSTSTISTGTATSGNTSNWSMKLSTSGSSYVATLDNSFGSYHTVPAEYTKVAHYNSATDLSTGSTLTTTYAAYINGTQSADTYAGKVKYTMVHPVSETPAQAVACQANRICYNANSSLVVGQMGQQRPNNTQLTNGIPLWAPNFKRDGYGFAGWNDAFDYSGNYYGPNQTITAPADFSTNGLGLYAVWIKSAGTLQNWVGCSGLASGATTALTDSRDGNTYAVAKLVDGKCWMIENLRLADKDSNNNDINLTSGNTHNPSLPLTNIYATSSTSNHLSPPSSVIYDATTAPYGWCTTNSSACNDQSRLNTDNSVLFVNNTTSNYSAEGNVYGYGNYYNWYSATAGHGKYGTDYGSSYTAPGDICPAGWHLPTGRSAASEYSLLDIALGGAGGTSSTSTTPTGATMSSIYRSYPNNFVFSGVVSSSLINYRNSGVYYSTSSGGGNAVVCRFQLGNTFVYPNTCTSDKFYGGGVRCITDYTNP